MTTWTPFDLAACLRSLNQGSLAVGNTTQRRANLLALATAEANAGAVWARWRTGNNVAKNHSNLLINVPAVPGYVAPPAE